MKLTKSAVKFRIATSIISVALVVLGLYGLIKLPVNFLPDVTYPLIRIHIYWTGATPEEIDKNVADVLERQMASVEGLDYLESSAIEGMYTLLLNFHYGVDVNVAYQDALAAMARATRNLPKDVEPPIIIKADPSQLPVVQLTISSDTLDLVKLRTWTEDWFQDQLMAVPGVAGTEIVGGLRREIRIHLHPSSLEKRQLTLGNVAKRLREENIEQFGGRITVGPREFIARTVGEYSSLKEISDVVLSKKEEGKIFLGDIARVEDASEDVRVITRLGGKPCVKLSVLKQADANTVEVAKAVSKRISELQPVLPSGIQLGMVENQADYIQAALKGVRNAALEGAILVIGVVYVFLGSWRLALIMALALPVTMILNFGLMKVMGFSLNIFSLGGLIVAIAVVLDNSIIVVENITRIRDESSNTDANKVAITATSEVSSAIIAATLSFIAIFVPFLLVPGLVSLLFRELILVIATVVIVSLLTAVTLTPMLASILLGKSAAQKHENTVFQRFFKRVTSSYEHSLRIVIRHRWAVVGLAAILLASMIIVLPLTGTEFLPRMDDGRVTIKTRLPTGASVHETDQVLNRVEELLVGDPLIETYFTLVGGKVWGVYTYLIANEGQIDIQLIPHSERKISTMDFIQRIRPKLAKINVPGGIVMAMPMPVKGIRNLGEADIEVRIKGQDIGKLFDLAQGTASAMNALAHFTNVYVSMDLTKPEYQIKVDRQLAAEKGISVSDIASTTRSLIQGTVVTRFREGGRYYNVRLVIPERDMNSRQDVENLILESSLGGYLRVGDVAKVVQSVGPVEIVRLDQVKTVVIRGDATGVTVGEALSGLKTALAKLDKPAGYEISFGGQALMMSQMKQTTVTILLFALFFSFVVLAVQFNSLRLPVLILICVPLGLSGLVFMLYVGGIPLGATVVIGALVVVAATVNEGVLLLTFAEELRRTDNLSSTDAVIQAAKIRLRPRLMTTIPVIMGLTPLALNIEEGGDMLQPMAAAAIGGLLMLIPVALFFMPCVYVISSAFRKLKL